MHRIAGRTMGLVGYGHIPRVLHRKLAGFSLGRVLVYDPYVEETVVQRAGAQQVSFQTLLAESDYISIHAPLTESTRHMFDAEAFSQVKPGVILVNTSRGGLVDTTALTAAIREGRVGWAGLDVHEEEPVPPDYPLLEMERVVLSDHRGFYSQESQAELQQKAARYAAQVLAGETPESVVNRGALA
jgi:D-3-phosphoglycerate dehydrogenase